MSRGNICLIVLALATGCASAGRSPVLATSIGDHGPYSRSAGDPAPEFTLFAEGHLARFSAVRGTVTLVTLNGNPSWPDCRNLRALSRIADEEQSPYFAVRMVSVGRPAEGADVPSISKRCGIRSGNVVLVTDRTGEIFDRFGTDAAGRFFVVNEMGRIVGSGKMTEAQEARSLLAAAVRSAERPYYCWD